MLLLGSADDDVTLRVTDVLDDVKLRVLDFPDDKTLLDDVMLRFVRDDRIQVSGIKTLRTDLELRKNNSFKAKLSKAFL